MKEICYPFMLQQIQKKAPTKCFLEATHLVRKDMDVNEHDRLSNMALRHKLK